MKKIIRQENRNTKVITVNDEKTRTQQQFKDQCDINKIIKRYPNIEHYGPQAFGIPVKNGKYLDNTTVTDYQASLDLIIEANNSFNSLPSDLRKRFFNDPKELLSFLNDPKNKEEAIQLGLINKPEIKPEIKNEPNPKPNENKTNNKNPNPPSE